MIKRIAINSFMTTVIVLLSACALQDSKSYQAINKSPNDHRNYSSIELSNKLQVMLISDASLETSGAALSVGVGSFQNPKQLPGLAHFLEHMLFLGTKKYPEVNGFQTFIKKNAGKSNAYTASDHTNYFFEVNNSAINEALDRFSDYFKTPSFNPEYIEKERNAVNSEWSLSKADDGRIINRLRGVTANSEHPIQNISVGNNATLINNQENNLSEATKRFYKEHYSANNMKLVLFGNKSIEELSQLAKKHFSTIENKAINKNTVDAVGLSENVLGQHIYYKPQKPLKKLVIEFPISKNKDNWKSKSIELVENIMSSEEPKTLAATLRKKGWISALTTSADPNYYGKDGFLAININLTDAGLKKENEIITAVFNYIDLIKTSNTNESIYNETKTIVEKAFQTKQTPSALMQAVHYSAGLFSVPSKHIIDAPYYYDAFNEVEVNNVLTSMTIKNARIWHINEKAPTNIKLKHYDGSYSVKKITPQETKAWSQTKFELSLPTTNDLINSEESTVAPAVYSQPKLLVKADGLEAWLMHSQAYQSQMGKLQVVFNSEEPSKNSKSWVIANLVNRIFSMQTTALQDKAGRAGIGIKIFMPNDNHAFSLTGFSEKHQVLYQQLLKKWVSFKASEQELTIAREGFIRKLEGKKQSKLYRQLFIELNRLVKIPGWSDGQLMNAVQSVTVNDMNDYVENLVNNNRIRIFAYGNYTDVMVKNIANNTEKALGVDRAPHSRFFTKYITPTLTAKKAFEANTEQTDNALLLAVYSPEPTFNAAADIALLNTLFNSAFYTALRTEEQIGYVVGSSYDQLDDYWGFLIYAQSTNTPLVALKRRFDQFIKDFVVELENMDDEVFSQLQRSLIAQLKQKPGNFSEESGPYFSDFYRGNDAFNSKEALIKAVENTSKASILSRYKALVVDKKGLQVQVQLKGSTFKDEPFIH